MDKTDPTLNPGKTYASQEQLAKAAGISQPTLSRELKRDGCPIRNSGPWDSDDLAALVEWRSAVPEGSVDDILKKAQAIKAQVLASRYLLDMSNSIGGVGRDLFTSLFTACSTATMMAFNLNQHQLTQRLKVPADISESRARQIAWEFAVAYCDSFAREVARVLSFPSKREAEMKPIILQMKKCLAEMHNLNQLPRPVLDEIEDKLAEARGEISKTFGIPLVPTAQERMCSGSDEYLSENSRTQLPDWPDSQVRGELELVPKGGSVSVADVYRLLDSTMMGIGIEIKKLPSQAASLVAGQSVAEAETILNESVDAALDRACSWFIDHTAKGDAELNTIDDHQKTPKESQDDV